MNYLLLQNEIADIKILCAGIKCGCSVSNNLSNEEAYCSAACRNSAVDETIDQVNDQCDCGHAVCIKGTSFSAEYADMTAEIHYCS